MERNAAKFRHKRRGKNKDMVPEENVISLMDYWNITEPDKDEL
jgi:hypothetical protein